MCRFFAYLGQPVILYDLLYKPVNSLINQSTHAREMDEPLNGDGFGISWYKPEIDNLPGVFKSIQPAWNNINLEMLSKKILSGCFLAHVRAASKGGISYFNTHPFTFKEFSFMHNGIIGGFESIKRSIHFMFSEEMYEWVKGQTDSEFFFALYLDLLQKSQKTFDAQSSVETFREAVSIILQLKKKFGVSDTTTLINSVISDGKRLYVFRYVSNLNREANSLYYSQGHQLIYKDGHSYMLPSDKHNNSVLVASESLSVNKNGWEELPPNHALVVNEDMNVNILSI